MLRKAMIATVPLLMLTACSDRTPADPAAVQVAVMDGRELTLADFQAYLEANLPEGPTADPEEDEEIRKVKSRLFDRFLDEEILLAEAERRGIVLDEGELATYNGVLRRSATVQKLVEEWAGTRLDVSEEEIDALLRERAPATEDDRELVLRSLRFEDPEEAARVQRQLRRRRITFDEAVVTHEQTSGQAAAMHTRLSDLPEEVREVVRELRAGRVSAPVEFQGGSYLFLVVSWAKEDRTADAGARESASVELFHRRFDDASHSLLEELKRDADLKIFPGNLAFDYVGEDEAR